MSFKEFLQDYGWALVIVAIIVTGVVLAVLINLPDNLGNQVDVISTVEPIVDTNFSVEHIALADNQQFILNEIQKLNLLSQCVVDTDNIVTREIPVDDSGTFRRVSIVPLICPELVG